MNKKEVLPVYRQNSNLNLDNTTSGGKIIKLNGKTIGRYKGNKFIKYVLGSKHKLNYPPSWAIDAEVFDNDVRFNAVELIVDDRETAVQYHSTIDNFIKHKGEIDRGFGRQYFLKDEYWEVINPNIQQRSLFDWGGFNNA